ncbi:SCO2521 family protein [Streptomyces sp. NPDC047081]|uniref:SCO2521 family protein n=1 Tax=Streptomyces sp. NPDC047081 TaxID=3154706 RepID=UPI0033C6E43E
MTAPPDTAPTVLACGEVRTCVLPSRQPLDIDAAAQLLQLRADERVLVSKRPNLYALSPQTLTGVDCRLPTANGAKVRVVGTVAVRAALTEGRILQSSAYFRTPAQGPDRRRPWGHYLIRPGVLEPLGRLPESAAAQGVLTGGRPGELDLGLIADGVLTPLVRHPLLDQRAPLKSRHTRLRWAALPAEPGQGPAIEEFTLAEDDLRTVRLRVPAGTDPAAIAALCEDFALHDWLLTTVVRLLDGRLGPVEGPDALTALRPAVEHLMHLWMPRARGDRALRALWDVLEHDPGFTRQWDNLVQRVRDRLALLNALPKQPIAQPARAGEKT